MHHQMFILFAQQKGPDPGAVAAGFGVFFFSMVCIGALLSIAAIGLGIFGYITLYKAFSAISPRNRDMEPVMIFLMLIPCFGPIWYFFVVLRLASSFEKEFKDRGLRAEGDFGKMLGIITPITGLCLVIPAFICGIIWLMKIRGYTAQIAGGAKRSKRRDVDEDEGDED